MSRSLGQASHPTLPLSTQLVFNARSLSSMHGFDSINSLEEGQEKNDTDDGDDNDAVEDKVDVDNNCISF